MRFAARRRPIGEAGVTSLRADKDADIGFPHIHAVAPSIDEAVIRREQEYVEGLSEPRLLKTHAHRSAIEPLARAARVIYVIRDPGDVLLSSYHHRMLQIGREISIEDYVAEEFLSFRPFGTWRDHVLSWWPFRDDANVLPLTYEGIVARPRETALTIAAFCGIVPSAADTERVIHRCTLGFMKEHWHKFDPRLHTIRWAGEGFIRRGESGGSKRLPPHIDDRVTATLSATSLELGDPGIIELFTAMAAP